jgi:hypothetical protein
VAAAAIAAFSICSISSICGQEITTARPKTRLTACLVHQGRLACCLTILYQSPRNFPPLGAYCSLPSRAEASRLAPTKGRSCNLMASNN